MKRICLVWMFIMTSGLLIIASAQNVSLNSLCEEWNVLEDVIPDGTHHYRTITQRLTNDTIIGSNNYVKIEGGYCDGALREGMNRDIYYIPVGSAHEYLLYAFNVQVGDKLDNLWCGGSEKWCPNGYKAVVTEITSGSPRVFSLEVEIELPGGGQTEPSVMPWTIQWIEGVGLTSGPCGNSCPATCEGDIATNILCAYKNGEQVYVSDFGRKYGCEYTNQQQDVEYIATEIIHSATKFVHNGQIFILRGDKIYTIQGQKVN